MEVIKVSNQVRTSKPRKPRSAVSRALLNNQSFFFYGTRRTFGSYYQLAKKHGKVCRTRRGVLHNESREGTYIWFEDVSTK